MSPRTARRSPSLRLAALGGAAGALVAGMLTAAVAPTSAVAAPASALPLSGYAIVDAIDMPVGSSGDAGDIAIRDDSIWVNDMETSAYQLNPFTNEWINTSGVTAADGDDNTLEYGLAVSDDTVYATLYGWGGLTSWPRGLATGAVDDSFPLSSIPSASGIYALTADAAGRAYAPVTMQNPGPDIVIKMDPSLSYVDDSVELPGSAYAYDIAVVDDTLFVPVDADDSIAIIRASDMTLIRKVPAAIDPQSVVATPDGRLFSGGDDNGDLVVADAAGTILATIPTSDSYLQYLAISADDTVIGGYYMINVFNSASLTLDDSLHIPADDYASEDVAIWDGDHNRGVAYVTTYYGRILVAAPVTASLSGSPASATITVSGPPDVIVDDSTVVGVDISGSAVPVTPLGGGQFSFDIGSATASDVAVRLYGGNVIGVSGGVTPTPTPPAPVSPPSAPLDVSAVPGDRSATVSWREPASPGSFPVSMYRVAASPGGGACLVAAPALTCTVSGLANGTLYTFRVEALNGAGWSPASGPSAPVTPGGVTPAPGPVPLPSPLDPGSSLLQVNGVVDPNVSVDPNQQDNGLTITGQGWSMDLDGLGPDGNPLNLGPDGVLRLATERDVATQGTGFLPNSEVDLYVDPPVLVQGAIGVRASGQGTYVGTVRTDASGSFSGTATLPDGIEPGDHVVQAVGYSPTRQSRAMSLGVVVEPWIVLDKGTRQPAGVHDRMSTKGTTGGIEAGAKLTPHIRFGSGAWKTGVATITVNSDGNFTWSRLVRKDKRLTAYVSYLDTESNRVVWARVR